jgi:ABC-2 type transport system permease protein
VNKLRAIIRREYLSRVRSKWFILSTILAPVLIVGALALPALLVLRQAGRMVKISVIDETGTVMAELLQTEAFREGRLSFVPPPEESSDLAVDSLRDLVRAGRISGYLYVPAEALEEGRVEYWARDAGQSLVRGSLRPAVTAAVRRLQARRFGLDPETADMLARPVEMDAYRVTEEGAARDTGRSAVVAHILGLAIYAVVIIYGAMMLRAAVTEKTNKTVEIVLSSVRPWQLMLGKILGVGAVGLTQLSVWLAIVVGFLVYAAGAQGFGDVAFLQTLPIGVDTLVLFVGLFLTGYFLYAGMYASVGAIASSEQEIQQLQLPVTIFLVVPILVIPVMLEAPTSPVSIILSWIPLFTPVLFLVRYVLDATAVWEVPLIFGLQVLAILLVAWLGGRIYRIGLLMTGKRPTLSELARWVRYG